MFTNVPAISRDAYTSFGSSSKLTMRLAEGCCLVFSIFTSLLFNENKATSAPEIVKVSNNRMIKIITRKVENWVLTASKTKER